MDKGSVAMCFVRSALAGAIERGENAAEILKESAIDPAQWDNDHARVSPESYSTLLKLIAQVLDDEMFGLDSRGMRVGSFAMLCHAAIHTPTLGKALRVIGRFFGLMLGDVMISLDQRQRLARLTLTPLTPGPPRHVFLFEALLTFIHGLACWLVRRRIPLLRADFCYPMPPYVSEYTLLYSSRLRFGRPHTAVLFEGEMLALPVVQTPRSLKTFLAQAPENMLVKYKNVGSPASRVRRVLRRLPVVEWPDLPGLAASLGVPPSTLRRHLSIDGTSVQAIKDALRYEMALLWLRLGDRSVAEIAADLGYAEPSAFHRAFRKWTGLTPGAFRGPRGVGPAMAAVER
jgi:AraC-like DNA-binding protein